MTAVARVDVAPRGGRTRPIWRYVGYDEPNYTYSDMGAELLDKLTGMAGGPVFVRCHFLLCSGDGTASLKWGSTNVFTHDAEGNNRYDWTILDRVLDTYVARGLVPFFEIGFTPEALSSALEGVPYESPALGSAWSYPPADLDSWRELMGRLVEHCVERYGLRELLRWRWELWNEPDIGYFTGTVAQYCELYDHTEHAIHERYPMLLVGGPSTTNPGSAKAAAFLDAFLAHCSSGTNAVTGKGGTRLDFVTFHAKGAHLVREPGAPKQTPTIQALVGHVQAGLDIVARYPDLADREIVVSECDPDGWAAGTRYDNPNLEYRNSEYYASYLAAAVISLLPLRGQARRGETPVSDNAAPDGSAIPATPPRVEGALSWAFAFEGRELFEGMRTLSTNGLDKPVLNALRLLERTGPLELSAELDGGSEAGHSLRILASGWEDGRIALLVASHHDDWDRHGPIDVAVHLRGLPSAACQRVEYRVDMNHGNAFRTWVAMDRPPYPDEATMARLEADSRLRPEEVAAVSAGPDGSAQISFTVELHSLTLVLLTPREAAGSAAGTH